MMNALCKTVLSATFTLTLVAAATGCAVGAQDEQQPNANEQESTVATNETKENTGTTQQELQTGSFNTGGFGALWCACKLNCENDYAGIPNLITACKKQCDTDNKCRTGLSSSSGGVIMY